ncbi:Holliday junction resolvase RuvX [Aquimarina agarivorans]|uniref:Holliday junction resolvase RuvX n=1 Tax=Aquimarina agarivorans TaxID=980584 RepID=UPI000248ED81|nr:Holliday junction resolvase RuvX [Aquimarina agarivorans]
MPQLVAIDYGGKRTGIAVTDDLQMIASGLTTVATNELMIFLKDYAQLNKIEAFVVGEPKRLHGEASSIEAEIKKFLEQLSKEFPGIKIHRVDERFTSKIAFEAMIKSGISKKKRRDKSLIDKISATLILQDFLNYR